MTAPSTPPHSAPSAPPRPASYPPVAGGNTASPGADEFSTSARARLNAVRAEVGKAVVGQDTAVSGMLIALLCRGHILLEGQRRKATDPSVKWAVVTMCIGGGQGIALAIERI